MRIIVHFGERLAQLMFEKNLNDKQFSKAVGLSAATVCLWRTGRQNISLSNALKLANFFNCSLDYLVGRSENSAEYKAVDCPPFYSRLIEIMKSRNISRYRIVRETKLSDGNFYSWKKGGDPFIQSVIDLADYFDCTLDYLAGRE